jgi:hypothetical protein
MRAPGSCLEDGSREHAEGRATVWCRVDVASRAEQRVTTRRESHTESARASAGYCEIVKWKQVSGYNYKMAAY